jgi:DNA polymerase III gamma/tau subunit
MGWAMFAQAAMQWTGGYLQARLNGAINDAQHITDDANVYSENLINNANADAANQVRSANNSLSAAQAALGNLQRSIGNQDKLSAFGSQLDANSENLARLQDTMVRGSFEDGLRASEQLGALHAQAATQGIGGSTAAMMHQTLALSAARAQASRDNNAEYQTFDMLQQKMGLMGNMVRSLDEGQSFAPVDYSVNVAPLVQSPIRAQDFAGGAASQAWVTMLGSSAGQQLMANIGEYFQNKGPAPSNTLDMNDGWNNFSTRNFSSTPNLGSGFYGVGGDSNGFFSTSGASASTSSYQLY